MILTTYLVSWENNGIKNDAIVKIPTRVKDEDSIKKLKDKIREEYNQTGYITLTFLTELMWEEVDDE